MKFTMTFLMTLLLALSAPFSTPGSTPLPDPGCTIPPLELPLFNGTPVVALATPDGSERTDEPSEQEIHGALEVIVACVNTGEPLQTYAVFAPSWFVRNFSDSMLHYLPALEQRLSYPPFTAVPLELSEVSNIQIVSPDRVTVDVTTRSGMSVWQDRLTLVWVDGYWLIDQSEALD